MIALSRCRVAAALGRRLAPGFFGARLMASASSLAELLRQFFGAAREDSGIDASAFCQLRMANGGIGTLHIGWVHGDAGFSIQGTDGYMTFVYDEPVGYFGFPVRAIRVFREGQPTETHYLPLEFNVMEPQLYRDLIETLAGRDRSYPAFGTDGRRSLEAAVAAYASDARKAIVEVPIPASDPVYERGLAALR